MHDLLAWIRDRVGDAPPGGDVDAADVVDELEETPLSEGYTSIGECDNDTEA